MTLNKQVIAAALSVALSTVVVSANAATIFIEPKDPALGKDAYKLIQEKLGSGSIESSDLGPAVVCHDSTEHITTQPDSLTGWAFRFNVHEGDDCDPTGTTTSTRERVEIKGYDGSSSTAKAFRRDTVTHKWLFRIDRAMNTGPRFTHVYQLKSVGGAQDSHPLLTFTGANGKFEVRHSDNDTILGSAPWSSFQGRWVEAYVKAKYAAVGTLQVTIKDVVSGVTLISINRTSIDMFKDGTYVRPKWGIYRENPDLSLGDASVRFADFTIIK